MGFTRQELIQFFDRLTELVSPENQNEAKVLTQMFISDFERSYQYDTAITEKQKISKLPPHYIAAMPDSVQEEIKQKVIAALTEHGELLSCKLNGASSVRLF